MQIAEKKHFLKGYHIFIIKKKKKAFNDYILCNFAFGGSSPAYLN